MRGLIAIKPGISAISCAKENKRRDTIRADVGLDEGEQMKEQKPKCYSNLNNFSLLLLGFNQSTSTIFGYIGR